MRKMAVIVAFATATAFALPTSVQAHSHHHRTHHYAVRSANIIVCNRQGCHGQTGSETRVAAARHASGGCPRNLGCGCNLANYLHIAGRMWRELWVAKNWARIGRAAHKGCTDCVAVLTRRGGGHVGIVKHYDPNGNPVIYSYANGRLGWTTTSYSARRVIAYRWVGGQQAMGAPTF